MLMTSCTPDTKVSSNHFPTYYTKGHVLTESKITNHVLDEISTAFHIDLQIHNMKARTSIPPQSSMHLENKAK